VAREASDIVLLEDDFGSIVHAIRLGRRIFDNIRKAMAFIFAVHVPIAGLALLPLFFGLPILLGPIHIALLELVIDPVCSLVFEAEREEDTIMQRPPRNPREPLFSLGMVTWSIFQGLVAFCMVAAVFLVEHQLGMPEDELRALVFFALIAQILAQILVNRSFSASLRQALGRRNTALRYVLIAVVAISAAILLWPRAQSMLQFGSISWPHMAMVVGLGILLLVGLETFKQVAGGRLARLRVSA
jgi:Ca2+-transporting ATPase